ncbi:hypothetical protein SALBM135S_07697 [Streptomyces alboniger]
MPGRDSMKKSRWTSLSESGTRCHSSYVRGASVMPAPRSRSRQSGLSSTVWTICWSLRRTRASCTSWVISL